MASKFTGTNQAVKYLTEYEFDPSYGDVEVQHWHGPKLAVMAMSSAFRGLGWRVKTTHKGPLWDLTALITTSAGTASNGVEVPTERWRVTTEWAQLDMRSNPKVIAAAGDSATLASWMSIIDAAIKAGKSLTDYTVAVLKWNGAIPVAAQALYDMRASGVESYEIRRPVLSRIRSFSPTYPTRFQMDAIEKVHSTPALVSLWAIPAQIQSRLPPNPPTKPNWSEWGWKMRRQDEDIILARNKVEEQLEWFFGAISTLLYDYIA